MIGRAKLAYALAALLALAAHAGVLSIDREAPPLAKIQSPGVQGVEIRLAGAKAEPAQKPEPEEEAPPPDAPQVIPATPAATPPVAPVPAPAAQAGAQNTAVPERRTAGREDAARPGLNRAQETEAASTAPEPLDTPENKSPSYPRLARQRGQSGAVTLKAVIDAGGLAAEVWISAGSGHSLLDKAALEAVRKWRFRPASLNGRPVPGEVFVTVEFRLE